MEDLGVKSHGQISLMALLVMARWRVGPQTPILLFPCDDILPGFPQKFKTTIP